MARPPGRHGLVVALDQAHRGVDQIDVVAAEIVPRPWRGSRQAARRSQGVHRVRRDGRRGTGELVRAGPVELAVGREAVRWRRHRRRVACRCARQTSSCDWGAVSAASDRPAAYHAPPAGKSRSSTRRMRTSPRSWLRPWRTAATAAATEKPSASTRPPTFSEPCAAFVRCRFASLHGSSSSRSSSFVSGGIVRFEIRIVSARAVATPTRSGQSPRRPRCIGDSPSTAGPSAERRCSLRHRCRRQPRAPNIHRLSVSESAPHRTTFRGLGARGLDVCDSR